MSDQERTTADSDDADSGENKSGREKVSDGIKQGIGFLSAFKDALEETIQEARERGDLSSDRAKEVMKDALDKAQSASGKARDKFDFVSQGEFDSLSAAVDAVKDRVARLEKEFLGDRRQPDEREANEDGAK